jgi:hypothetical protein
MLGRFDRRHRAWLTLAACLLGACHLVGGIEEGIAACEVDGAVSGLETDIDCGGPCAACSDGASCADDSDCQSSVCQAGQCIPPTCDDSRKNGLETDVDCGGPNDAQGCRRCLGGETCASATDCASGVASAQGDEACIQGVCRSSCCGDDCDGCCDAGTPACGADGYESICILDLDPFCEPPLRCFPVAGVDGMCR